ncbi:hypothetical protein ACFO1B_03475 [Dactylosporangium siamense]|uniref:Uncharacterized protein n=1 Tax=Dactylosporangium siamense TaxID=685454 RepID=A0A919U5A7_9ACTN|nr:hypothetical protein [Dactylosporangium siamense]GIG43059.1 hypothetical protein Dsi01nite_011000 [Dactylosporangium siamense]
MSTDLDQRLAATLRDRAGGDVDPAPIVAWARHRGGRLRFRRRMLAGAAAGCTVVLAAVALVRVEPRPHTPAMPPSTLALPVAPGLPGALQRPGAVGADPGVVHFSADDVLGGAEYATWQAGRGTESVEIPNKARVLLATDVAALDAAGLHLASARQPRPPVDVLVGDRPGTAWSDAAPTGGGTLWTVRWQPAGGLWAQLDLYTGERGEATAAAARVRFDAAHRCVVPFRLDVLPVGARIRECSVRLGAGGFVSGALIVDGGGGRWLAVRAERRPPGVGESGGDLVAGPYRVRRVIDGQLEMLVQQCLVDAFLADRGDDFTEQDALTVLGGYRPALDLDHPDTW